MKAGMQASADEMTSVGTMHMWCASLLMFGLARLDGAARLARVRQMLGEEKRRQLRAGERIHAVHFLFIL